MARFKRSLLGYKSDQVDEALATADARAAETERESLLLSEMLVGRDRELETLKQQLADAHARHDRSLQSLETLARHVDEIHAQARGQATRIRLRALNEAVKVTERAGEAMGAIREIEEAADRVGYGPVGEGAPTDRVGYGPAGEGSATDPGDRSPAADRSAGTSGADPPLGASTNGGSGEAAGIPAEQAGSEPAGQAGSELGYFQGDVEVEIGPLGDFSQLLGFESAAGRIEGAREISVRRFASGRVTLGMQLDEPIALLRELEERSPFEFKVRQTGGRRLVLDIDEDADDLRPDA